MRSRSSTKKRILRAETLRFEDELRTPEDAGLPKIVKPAAADVRRFESEIAKRAKKFDPRELLDDSTRRIEKLVKEKEKKKEDVVRVAEPEKGEGLPVGGWRVEGCSCLARERTGLVFSAQPFAPPPEPQAPPSQSG